MYNTKYNMTVYTIIYKSMHNILIISMHIIVCNITVILWVCNTHHKPTECGYKISNRTNVFTIR